MSEEAWHCAHSDVDKFIPPTPGTVLQRILRFLRKKIGFKIYHPLAWERWRRAGQTLVLCEATCNGGETGLTPGSSVTSRRSRAMLSPTAA